MSRTIRKDPPRWYNKETKYARKQTYRQFRRASKVAVDLASYAHEADEDDWDEAIPDKPVHTEGHITH